MISVELEKKKPFLDYTKTELAVRFKEMGIPSYRLGQIRRWIFARKTGSFSEMTDLSKDLRACLRESFSDLPEGKDSIFSGEIITTSGSPDGTQKILLELADGNRVESVLLRDDRNHRTGCISTQVGCAMGCAFCASGMDGFIRNLTRGEILEQILRINSLLPPEERLTHLVIMGTGEPTLNLEPLLSALEDATAQDGLDIGNRKITISTVGLPEGIRKMAAANVPYKLAVSLHAPNDEIRDRIIPQNRRTGIAKILEASDFYFHSSGRRTTFEYILIDDLNSRPEHARQLASLLKNRTAIVNIIPYNPVPEFSFKTPSSAVVHRFVEILEEGGIQVKVRFRKGDGINAACGQLRRSFRKNSDPDLSGKEDPDQKIL
ncbi:MAG: 23S rRNA (adenine(2503)-C(2))-methyltransferase RlmN [Planctomycetia bacterium]|nr:23S rRNA (adenine(2503)-C(2))-methyltransferase RlmN [Planctomycetia bacterium]